MSRDDEVRALFQDELAGLHEPPLGTLVPDAVQQGRRMRLLRRLYGSAVMAGGLAIAAVLAVQTGYVAGLPVTGRLIAAASPAGRTTATPEGLLQVLLDDLPSGRTSHFAKAAGGAVHAQAFLDDGSGWGMVRVGLPARAGVESSRRATWLRSWKLADGSVATVVTVPDDCTRALHVEVERSDGVLVSVDVGSCLAWDGLLLGRGRTALTVDQAVAIANDPRLGPTMPQQLVQSGAHRFRDLPTFE